MTMLASPPPATIEPDDIPKMDGLFELVDDRLVEKNMSFLSGATCVKLNDHSRFLHPNEATGNPGE
jgi:hypothetical protein